MCRRASTRSVHRSLFPNNGFSFFEAISSIRTSAFILPMWICDVEGCSMSRVRNLGDRVLCNRHLCSKHATVDTHKCPRWKVCKTISLNHPRHLYIHSVKALARMRMNTTQQRLRQSSARAWESSRQHRCPCVGFPDQLSSIRDRLFYTVTSV